MAESAENAEVLHFPENFMWGTATSAYQIEGGAALRGASVWDTFCATPGKTLNGENGSVACDHFGRFKEDVQLIKALGTKYYRFSLSWPRLLPNNSPSPSPDGVLFYRSLLQELIDNGITPVATLFHWETPVYVDEATGGWAGNEGTIAEKFAEYARVCYEQLGDLVQWWITLNEPWCSALLGYETGIHAPGETDAPGVKVYRAGHNLLLAHAKAVDVYRTEFQERQHGCIGITLNVDWAEPKTEDAKEAAERAIEFSLGWFADPLYFGEYPRSMVDAAGDRLPRFTREEKDLVKGSTDFFGVNHYATYYVTGMKEKNTEEVSYYNDLLTNNVYEDPNWEKTDMGWSIVPWGITKLLCYIDRKYNPAGGIIVFENGLAAPEKNMEDAMKDTMRIPFYRSYIQAVHTAITKFKVDVKGYFLWTLLDNFEWTFGYSKRFGLYFVDFETQERIAKPAADWYMKVVTNNALHLDDK